MNTVNAIVTSNQQQKTINYQLLSLPIYLVESLGRIAINARQNIAITTL
jgi:hypothetical protein